MFLIFLRSSLPLFPTPFLFLCLLGVLPFAAPCPPRVYCRCYEHSAAHRRSNCIKPPTQLGIWEGAWNLDSPLSPLMLSLLCIKVSEVTDPTISQPIISYDRTIRNVRRVVCFSFLFSLRANWSLFQKVTSANHNFIPNNSLIHLFSGLGVSEWWEDDWGGGSSAAGVCQCSSNRGGVLNVSIRILKDCLTRCVSLPDFHSSGNY